MSLITGLFRIFPVEPDFTLVGFIACRNNAIMPTSKYKTFRAGEMTQWARCSWCQLENLSSDSFPALMLSVEKVVVHVCNPSAEQVQPAGSQESWIASQVELE